MQAYERFLCSLCYNELLCLLRKHSPATPIGSTQGCGAFPYKQMVQCDHKAQKVNLRTTSGLFEVQGIDYKTQTMTISDPSMSTCSTLNPITHQHFSVDSVLPPTPHNTILLFNCPLALASSGLCKNSSQSSTENLPGFPSEFCQKHCGVGLKELEQGSSSSSSSLPCCATDFERLGNRSLGELRCKHYVNVYGGVEGSKWGYGIRLSFNLPDQIPDVRLCDECDKQDGNCGIGLKCICHPHECENTVLSRASVQSPSYRTILGELLFSSIFTGLGLWNLL